MLKKGDVVLALACGEDKVMVVRRVDRKKGFVYLRRIAGENGDMQISTSLYKYNDNTSTFKPVPMEIMEKVKNTISRVWEYEKYSLFKLAFPVMNWVKEVK